METEKPFLVTDVPSLNWPTRLKIPSTRFRLFVAADVTNTDVNVMSSFARDALTKGMVSFCSWGLGCERFHDIVDEVVVEDDIGKRLFAGPNQNDVIRTTWHGHEPLPEALNYFTRFAQPTEGFFSGSHYWVAITVRGSEWAAAAEKHLEESFKQGLLNLAAK
jgi:hypothetical protein